MGAVDFTQWAVPDLELTFGGRTYLVPPPDVDAAAMILAAAVRAEVNFGMAEGPLPPEIQSVVDTIGNRHPALSDAVFEQMRADGVPAASIDRLAVYALFYWARGQAYADAFAKALWTPLAASGEGSGGANPKGSSRPRTGRRTASVNPTPKAGTRTTGRSRRT